MNMRDLLSQIVSSPEREAAWLHTLSLLEYMGARKISKTMYVKNPSSLVLQHMADESRHAYAFKKLAVAVNPTPSQEPHYLAREAAVHYFQTLDQTVEKFLQEKGLSPESQTAACYYVVTSLIERRAMKVYPLYKKVTLQENIRQEMAAIIEEEVSHRGAIDEKAHEMLSFDENAYAALVDIEEKLFETFLSEIQKTLH